MTTLEIILLFILVTVAIFCIVGLGLLDRMADEVHEINLELIEASKKEDEKDAR